jgi:RHS repeat-associated protein
MIENDAHSYDAVGRLATVADPSRTYLSGMQYLGKGNAASQMALGNGTVENYTLNDRLQMTSQSLLKGVEVLQKYDYSYGTVDVATGSVDLTKNNGQLGKIEGTIGTAKQWSQRFGYDALGRLSEAREYKQGNNAQLSYKQKFDFDRFGNLYRKAASNPTAGQQNPLAYTPIEETTTPGTGDIEKATNRFRTNTTYDDAGNVTTDNKFRTMGFAYDANGRQVKASRTSVPDAWTVYDASGNRVATKINDVWQYVIYDAFGKLVAEYGVASEGLGGVKYVQQDWQGSVRTTTNSNGFVVGRTDHQAFGNDVGYGVGQRSVEQGYSVGKVARQGYGLTERDDATGQDHTWFRKNENQAGRWTSPDPYNGSMNLGDPQSFNRYSYVTSDPTNFVDPSGLLLRYFDVSMGMGCVLMGDGKFHCTEYINRYWYDDGAGGGGGGLGHELVYAGGGGGSGNSTSAKGKPTASQIQAAVNFCLNKIWETAKKAYSLYASLDYAVSGASNGSSTVAQTYRSDGRSKTMTFLVDATSKSGAQLSADNRGMRGRDGGGYLMGLTFGSVSTSSIANDLDSNKTHTLQTGLDELIGESKGTQIHELGVAVSFWLGQVDPPAKYTDDRDTGTTFEDCVYNKLRGR